MNQDRVKRKLTTILAADVEGYTRLMRADEEATLKTISDYRDIIGALIARYEGRVVDMVGDSVLAEFGSAVEAVRCAIAIQEEIVTRNAELPDDRKLRFRIGINVGDVIVKGDALFGDGVNVAARLEGLVEPGGICISGSVFEQIKHKLSLGFEDMGRQEVKNIAEPILAYRLIAGPMSEHVRTRGAKRRRIPVIAAVVVVIVALVGGLAWWQPWAPEFKPASVENMAYPLPDKPSIAVLPFTNMSDDPKQEYFSDGITEDIITDLSKVSGLFVIARTATLRYKGKPVDPRQVSRELGVRYLLEGSVRMAANKLRITAQLIDSKTGNHMWAERYDRDLKDVFAIQDDVAKKVVSNLAVTLKEGEFDRLVRRHTQNVEANELYQRAIATMLPPTPKNLAAARRMYEKAMELDSQFAGGYAGLSWIHAFYVETGISKSPRDDLETAFRLAKKAVALDDTMAKPHTALANAYILMRQHDNAIAAIRKAIQVEPGYAAAHALYGWYLGFAGRAKEGIKPIKLALRMSPGTPFMLFFLGANYRLAGQYEKAIEVLEELRRRLGSGGFPELQIAAAYMQAGRGDDAQAVVRRIRKMAPKFSLKDASRLVPYKKPEDMERYLGALRKAGMPE